MSKKYFHKLSRKKIDKLIGNSNTWDDIMKKYKQPKWCTYPNALGGLSGCWSLVDISETDTRSKICRKFCKDCDLYSK